MRFTNFTVEVVKVKGRVPWMIKATVDGVSRYRGFHYKKDTLNDLSEWQNYYQNSFTIDIFCAREFNHNFNSAEELNIIEA